MSTSFAASRPSRALRKSNSKGNPDLITIIGDEMDRDYLAAVKTLSLSPEAIERHKDLKIVYTPSTAPA